MGRLGALEWLSQLNVLLLVPVQVMILGLGNQVSVLGVEPV